MCWGGRCLIGCRGCFFGGYRMWHVCLLQPPHPGPPPDLFVPHKAGGGSKTVRWTGTPFIPQKILGREARRLPRPSFLRACHSRLFVSHKPGGGRRGRNLHISSRWNRIAGVAVIQPDGGFPPSFMHAPSARRREPFPFWYRNAVDAIQVFLFARAAFSPNVSSRGGRGFEFADAGSDGAWCD